LRRVHLSLLAALLLLAGCSGGSGGGGDHAAGERLVRVPSSSMEPTLHCKRPGVGCLAAESDYVVVQTRDFTVKRLDIIAFNTPRLASTVCGAGGIFLKRVVGLPGEVWAERNGYVYIDGEKLNEPYVKAARRDDQTLTMAEIPPKGKLTAVPADTYFLMATTGVCRATHASGAWSRARMSSGK
jgi:signal peptidase I